MAQEITQIVLRVNGEDALKKVKQYEEAIKRCNTEKNRLEEANKNGGRWRDEDIKHYKELDKELKAAQKGLSRTEATATQVGRVMRDLSGASIPELTRSLRALEAAQKNVTRGSKDWQEVTTAISRVKGEIASIREESAAAANVSTFAGITDNARNAFNAVKQGAGVISSLVDEYAAAAEHMAGVSKYTGLTEKEVKALNDDFARINTKTGRDALNDLAADAGRLGIKGRQNILDFVSAADTINIALGEDLGEGAVKEIGKLAALFGDDKELGLKQSMLSTASVINELAQTSSAAEGYIMEFTSRLGGMAVQAGMSQADVMGFAAVMDQAKVNAEEGSTALSRLLQVLYKEPAKIASVMKLDVAEFTNLLKTDANAALIQFLQAAKDMGGIERLAPALGELSLTGAGVTKTIAALAANLDTLKSTQVQAAVAFQEGTSVVKEADKANNTAAANLAKQRERFALLRQELGGQLLPVANSTLKVLAEMAAFFTKNAAVIAPLILSILALNAAVKSFAFISQTAAAAARVWAVAVTTWRVISITATGGVHGLTLAMKALNLSIASNPVGLLVTALTALLAVIGSAAAALFRMNKEEKEAAAALERRAKGIDRVGEAQKRAASQTEGEIARIQALKNAANDITASYQSRQKAMQNLAKIIPGFNASQSLEAGINQSNTAAIDAYIKKLNEKALAEAYYEEYKAALAKKAKATTEVYKKTNNLALVDKEIARRRANPVTTQTGSFGTFTNYNTISKSKQDERAAQAAALKNATADLTAANNELNAIAAVMKKSGSVAALFNEIRAGGGGGVPTTNAGTYGGEVQRTTNNVVVGAATPNHNQSYRNDDPAQKIKERANRELIIAKLSYQNGLTTFVEYNEKEENILRDSIKDRLKITKEGTKEYADLQRELYDLNEKYGHTAAARSLSEIENSYKAEKALSRSEYARGVIDKEVYQTRLDEIDKRYLLARLNYQKKYGSTADIQKAEDEIQQKAFEDQLKKREAFMQRLNEITARYNVSLDNGGGGGIEDDLKAATELMNQLNIRGEEQKRILDGIRKGLSDIGTEAKNIDLGAPTDAISTAFISFGNSITSLSGKVKEGNGDWKDYAAVAVAGLGLINSVMQSVSELFSAKQEEESAAVTEKYDKMIADAEGDKERTKQLEEEKNKELGKIKKKYANKEMKMKIAMAVAQTAQNALLAYASLAVIPVVGHLLGGIAAAAAVAAGAIQIAVIKKQAEAAAGYYEGGFTGGNRYRRKAGIVHEGEFVANHQTVNNPAFAPILSMIDTAQRQNRVASITAADVTRAIGSPALAIAAATPNIVSGGNHTTIIQNDKTAEVLSPTIERLNNLLEGGIRASVSIDGRDGVAYNLDKYRRLTK